jgi:hypothetical protein
VLLGLSSECRGQIFELIECGINADECELRLDNFEIKAPHVREEASIPASGVVPPLARSARSVRAPSDDNKNGRRTLEKWLRSSGHTGIGDDQFLCQFVGQSDGSLLFFGPGLGRRATAEDCSRPGGRRNLLHTDMASSLKRDTTGFSDLEW